MKSFKYAVVLTGGIATGKSTVAEILNRLGFYIIDADRVAHLILDREYKEIERLFGSRYVVDIRVDRKALGGLIFTNRDEKKKLESLLHPLIYIEIERVAKKQDRLKKPYVIDIPLFFETNRYPIEKKIVVYISQKRQLERLMSRDNSSSKEAQQRIDAQMDIELKREKASYLIDNSGDLKALQEECVKVKQRILYDFK
jgi:dephospho-CoA kinase